MASTSSLRYGIRRARKITTASGPSLTLTLTSSSSALRSTRPTRSTTCKKRYGAADGRARVRGTMTALTLLQWISEVLHFCQGLPIILVGCKKDLRYDQKTIEELHKTSQKPVTPEQVRTSTPSPPRQRTCC